MSHPLIAVIETNPVMSLLLDELLLGEGYQVCLWPSPEGAVAFIRHRQPDLIILDLWLQRGNDGDDVDTLEQFCSDEMTRHIPMLLCVGDPEMLPHEALRRLEQYIVLAKPFLLDEFTKQLCGLVDLLISRSRGKLEDDTIEAGAISQSAAGAH